MKWRDVLAIYRKDMLETFRDRRTLLFVLFIPVVTMGALGFSGKLLGTRFISELVTREIVVAADDETRRAYVDMAHRAFLASPTGRAMAGVSNPLLGIVLPAPLRTAGIQANAGELLTDPEAFERWAREMASKAKDRSSVPSGAGLGAELPDFVANEAGDFLRTTIRGVGLVRWVDPAEVGVSDLDSSATLPRSIDAYLSIRGGSDPSARPWRSVRVTLRSDGSRPQSKDAEMRIRGVLDAAEEAIVGSRLRSVGQSPTLVKVLDLETPDRAQEPKRVLRTMVAGLIPYFLMIFVYLGAIFPAIDLGAGEKERNTLETLLLTPVSRFDIALGKFLVVLTTAVASAVVGMGSLCIVAWLLLPASVLALLGVHLSIGTALMVLLMALPVAAAFSGLFLGIAVLARSFKEAQNYLAPAGIVMTLAPAYGLMPWAELNMTTASIPLLGPTLLVRTFLTEGVPFGLVGLSLLSSSAIAVLALGFCTWQFQRESVLFRT